MPQFRTDPRSLMAGQAVIGNPTEIFKAAKLQVNNFKDSTTEIPVCEISKRLRGCPIMKQNIDMSGGLAVGRAVLGCLHPY